MYIKFSNYIKTYKFLYGVCPVFRGVIEKIQMDFTLISRIKYKILSFFRKLKGFRLADNYVIFTSD